MIDFTTMTACNSFTLCFCCKVVGDRPETKPLDDDQQVQNYDITLSSQWTTSMSHPQVANHAVNFQPVKFECRSVTTSQTKHKKVQQTTMTKCFAFDK